MLLNDKYFHSIHSYIQTNNRKIMLDDIIDKMEKIFSCGYILPYRDIEKLYGDTISKNNCTRLNGEDFVSVSLHESNPQSLDNDYKNEMKDYEDAFQSFILQEPSIVLDSRIDNELKILKCGGIYLERLVAEPIPLEYMCAISVFAPGMLEPFFRQVPDSEYDKFLNDSSFRMITIECLDKIRGLLKKYNYDVPLVDICSGNLYKENESYRSYVKTFRK